MNNYKTCFLPPKEYGKIISEINTNYKKYQNKKFAIHMSYDLCGNACWYFFENNGYDNFHIIDKKYVNESAGGKNG